MLRHILLKSGYMEKLSKPKVHMVCIPNLTIYGNYRIFKMFKKCFAYMAKVSDTLRALYLSVNTRSMSLRCPIISSDVLLLKHNACWATDLFCSISKEFSCFLPFFSTC